MRELSLTESIFGLVILSIIVWAVAPMFLGWLLLVGIVAIIAEQRRQEYNWRERRKYDESSGHHNDGTRQARKDVNPDDYNDEEDDDDVHENQRRRHKWR